MAGNSIFVLGVALLTWGGVFLYLLRLAALAKSLDAHLKSHLAQREEERAQLLGAESLRADSLRADSEAPQIASETAPLSLP